MIPGTVNDVWWATWNQCLLVPMLYAIVTEVYSRNRKELEWITKAIIVGEYVGSIYAQSVAAARAEQALSDVTSSMSSNLPRPGPNRAWHVQLKIWLLTGELYVRLGKCEEALACAQEAATLSPVSHHVMFLVEWLLPFITALFCCCQNALPLILFSFFYLIFFMYNFFYIYYLPPLLIIILWQRKRSCIHKYWLINNWLFLIYLAAGAHSWDKERIHRGQDVLQERHRAQSIPRIKSTAFGERTQLKLI